MDDFIIITSSFEVIFSTIHDINRPGKYSSLYNTYRSADGDQTAHHFL